LDLRRVTISCRDRRPRVANPAVTVRPPRTARGGARGSAPYRDAGAPGDWASPEGDDAVDGRQWIAVIGIDGYRPGWPRLRNAVKDARGVLDMFKGLGFQPAADPLLDGAATRDALNRLVSDDLRSLHPDDSLIVFFAGHGHTAKTPFTTRGYLIPVDADHPEGNRHTWIRLEHWLSDVAELPPHHILVFLDSCYSGIALDHDIRCRADGPARDEAGPRLARRSRRVITSSSNTEPALDGGGTISGHSLFTSCLIQAIRGGRATRTRERFVLGDALGIHLRDQVSSLSKRRQTPDTGKLALDAGGEFRIPIAKRSRPSREAPATRPVIVEPDAAHDDPRSLALEDGVTKHATTVPSGPILPSVQTESWALDPAFVAALDRHAAERVRGYQVLTVIGGSTVVAQTTWATWAARRGYLTLLSAHAELAAVIEDLLAQTPWLRCLTEARRRLAAAAGRDIDAVDAELDARSTPERRRWISDVAAFDRHVQVSGWLLSGLREARSSALDLATAPVQGSELLGIACDLAAPTAVLLHHPGPTETWLAQAIATAAALTPHMRSHSVAVSAPDDLVTRVLHGNHDSRALTMARQGRIAPTKPADRLPGRDRSRTMRELHAALGRDPRTRGRFELDAQVALSEGGPLIDVDLLAPRVRIAVELDGWHHFYDPEGYRRDRDQDKRLQRAGYFVIRFLAEDVDDRLASTLDQIALALAGRRASGVLH
jgi:very-short-patch-repair endonuclease